MYENVLRKKEKSVKILQYSQIIKLPFLDDFKYVFPSIQSRSREISIRTGAFMINNKNLNTCGCHETTKAYQVITDGLEATQPKSEFFAAIL